MSCHPLGTSARGCIYAYGTAFYDPLEEQYRMWYISRLNTRHDYTIPELELTGENRNRGEEGYNRNSEVSELSLYAESNDGINSERSNPG